MQSREEYECQIRDTLVEVLGVKSVDVQVHSPTQAGESEYFAVHGFGLYRGKDSRWRLNAFEPAEVGCISSAELTTLYCGDSLSDALDMLVLCLTLKRLADYRGGEPSSLERMFYGLVGA